MIDGIERDSSNDRRAGGWPIVASAWVLVVLGLLLLAGVSAAACPHKGAAPHRLAGAVIPQHDPCAGPGLASAYTVDGCRVVPLNEDRTAYW